VTKSANPLRHFYQTGKRSVNQALFFPLLKFISDRQTADIAIFHRFYKPPYGGGNQFLLALRRAFSRQGFQVENNRISATTRACLYNSYNFDFDRLRYLRRQRCLMVHRVDGPITVYRGVEDGSDQRIWAINRELADVTIFQSQYSWQKHLELGLEFKSPLVITNACDPAIFHRRRRLTFSRQRKVRLISTSWSANPRKGGDVYAWLDAHLDWGRYDYTFVGNSSHTFNHIRHVPPVPSRQLAGLLRQHDIYITASRHDPCSNALLEALSCGLPALYLNSGGHPELVREGGLPFAQAEEIPALLESLVAQYEQYQANISAPSLEEVARQYLQAMQLWPQQE
jgi:glycosyltransferase involved in cell wall biosynthesis